MVKHTSTTHRSAAGLVRTAGVVLAVLGLCTAAIAQRPPRHGVPQWRGDISRFHEHDWALWRGGRWVHAPHDGRIGWWWVAGGQWYLYPAPVYPYPNPWEPPPVALPPLPPPTPYWYYCDAPQGYYPYISSCPGGWKQVPATPGAAPLPQSK